MADIEIYDENNESVPYFINSFIKNSDNEEEYLSNSIYPKFSSEEIGNTTLIKIEGIRNLKLESITLKTDSIFKRKVTFQGNVSKMLYNLDFDNKNDSDLTIPLDHLYKVNSETAEIRIDNNDDKPIKVSEIEVKYFVDEIIFDGSKSMNYELKFGNIYDENKKNYDISNYKDLILEEGYDVLDLKDIKEEALKTPVKEEYDYGFIFNIAISLTAIVMGLIIFLKLKNK